MIGTGVGRTVAGWRDALARTLVRAHVTPNILTLAGTAATVAAGFCLALGAGAHFGPTLSAGSLRRYDPNAWTALAFLLLFLSAASDMLDGAVARLAGQASTFGAFLDSTLDRLSDFAIFTGIAFYFVARGNLTYALLPGLCIFWGLMISYTRARAEDLIQFCTVGYWQRGERMAAVLIAVLAHNIPALLWQQATLPALTVWARIRYTYAAAHGLTYVTDPRQGSALDRLKLWRYPRGTLAYDLVTGANILWLILAPLSSQADPLGAALGLK